MRHVTDALLIVACALIISSCQGGKAAARQSTRGAQPTSAARSNSWNIHCRQTSPEGRVPERARARARQFFPWAGRSSEIALGPGPVYALMGSSGGAISRDGDSTDERGFYVHRTLFAIDSRYRGSIVVRGARLGVPRQGRAVLWFSTNGAAHCGVHPPNVTCAPAVLYFAVPGPDYGTSGW
jgi:hypothetical protein